MGEVERAIELAMLYDFYGELLKEHQKEIFEDYVLNDFSLGEIASEQRISRQGVYDIVKRCTKQLEEYEKKLQLIVRFQKAKSKTNELKAFVQQIEETGDITLLEQVKGLSDSILELL